MKIAKVMIKKLIIVIANVMIIIASVAHATPEQYVALTGGTNGFGAKYTCAFSFMNLDFGFPFFYWSEKKEDDGFKVDLTEMQFNPYLSASVQVYKKERSSFNLGIAWEEKIRFRYNTYRTINDTSLTGKKTEEGFTYVPNVCPIFEYIQRGKDLNKLFGAQLFPVVLNKITKNNVSFKLAIQLNYFIRKIRPID